MCASAGPELVRVNDCCAGPVASPQLAGPKSSVVGQPLTVPFPPCPVNDSAATLVPHVGLVVEMAAVAVTIAVDVGVNCALTATTSFGLRVMLVPPSVSAANTNSGSDGGVSMKVAGALPVLTRCIVIGADVPPTAVVGNAKVVGSPGASVSVAPVAVADSGIVTLPRVGSLVNRLSEPETIIPAAAVLTMFAETVMAPVMPGATDREVGDMVN